ncbi:hypothetical protein RvY_00200 [Ramazzottius varieornatus]|uniref:Uncharacterized protein n=1 Tax=Ramazzottius varieornatus TaxID=947166 RepID=A0A1D1UMF2_RAMVA|nr:hypothetical protein RvY_00200 [Ramazzottius varieornatus]
MTSPGEDASLRKSFDEQGYMRERRAEGSTICTIKAAVAIVLDQYLTTEKDWKAIHKDECPLLAILQKVCPDQPTDFARLFTRSCLHANV